MNTHDAWERIHSTQIWGGYPSEHVIRFVARNYYNRVRNEVKILDFGCGTGANTWFLAREGFDTYAFDISESAISKLNDRMKNEGLKVNAICSDGMSLPYEEKSFDAIIDNVSIFSNPMKDIKKMYEKCFQLLIRGGKLMTVVFSKETTGYGTGIEIEPGSYEGIQKGPIQSLGIRHFFNQEELESCLYEVGFGRVVIEKMYYTDNGNKVAHLLGFADK